MTRVAQTIQSNRLQRVSCSFFHKSSMKHNPLDKNIFHRWHWKSSIQMNTILNFFFFHLSIDWFHLVCIDVMNCIISRSLSIDIIEIIFNIFPLLIIHVLDRYIVRNSYLLFVCHVELLIDIIEMFLIIFYLLIVD